MLVVKVVQNGLHRGAATLARDGKTVLHQALLALIFNGLYLLELLGPTDRVDGDTIPPQGVRDDARAHLGVVGERAEAFHDVPQPGVATITKDLVRLLKDLPDAAIQLPEQVPGD